MSIWLDLIDDVMIYEVPFSRGPSARAPRAEKVLRRKKDEQRPRKNN